MNLHEVIGGWKANRTGRTRLKRPGVPPGGQSLKEMGAMTGLLLLLWAGVTVGSVVDLQKRIINGHDCPQGDREYHVTLIYRKGDKMSFCGGSLISNEWILTAAHCWKVGPRWWTNGWTLTAVLGRYQNSTRVVITEKAVFFKDKSWSLGKRKDDIMLLKIPAQPGIATVSLPDCTNPLNIGDGVQIAGRGYTTTDPDGLKVPEPLNETKPLQCGDTMVEGCEDYKTCLERIFPTLFPSKADEYFLCFNTANVDTAPGDSGGGVVFNRTIYGVIVMGGEYACTISGAAMKVCKYMDWIVEKTGLPRPSQG